MPPEPTEHPTGRLRWRRAGLDDLGNQAVIKSYQLGDGGYILQQEWAFTSTFAPISTLRKKSPIVHEWRDIPLAIE